MKMSLNTKMVLYFVPTFLLVFGSLMSVIVTKQKGFLVTSAEEYELVSAKKDAIKVSSEITEFTATLQGFVNAVYNNPVITDSLKIPVIQSALENVLKSSDNLSSLFLVTEKIGNNGIYSEENGTICISVKKKGRYTVISNIYDYVINDRLAAINESVKEERGIVVIEPDTLLGSSDDLNPAVAVPILVGGKVVGSISGFFVIDNECFASESDITEGALTYIVSDKGTVVSGNKRTTEGGSIASLFPEVDEQVQLLDKISLGEESFFDIEINDGKFLFVIVPIEISNAKETWSLVRVEPMSLFYKKASRLYIFASVILLTLTGIIFLIILLISKNIVKPLKRMIAVLKKIAQGDIDSNNKLKVSTGDEIEEMSLSANSLIDGLSKTADFAKTIGSGNLDAEYKKAGDNDMLGSALLEMRESLKKAAEEDKKRKIEDEKQNWITHGVAKFGEILRQHNKDIEELSYSIISELVDYVGAIQGALFVKTEEDGEVFFEMVGSIAYDRKKDMEVKFGIGDGLVGRCAFEKLSIYMEDVPQDYVHITSGLGETNPRTILIVPAILNGKVYAIIELISFNKFEKYQIEFVEKIGETIASTIANAKVTEHTNKLLQQSKQQAEELAAQEEEMRQNMEELQATQDEVARLRAEEQEKSRKLIEEIEMLKAELEKYKRSDA